MPDIDRLANNLTSSCVLMVLLGLSCVSDAATLELKPVIMDAERIAHLDIHVQRPEAIDALPLAWVPARVVVPPDQEFIVSTPQAGVISRIHVALGNTVQAGETVAEIQSPDWLLLQRNLLTASTEFNLARAKYNRDQQLMQEGVIARSRWQETQSVFEKAETALRETEQILATQGMSAREIITLKAQRQLSNVLPLRSPIKGILLERLAVAGQRVDMLTPLFRIGNVDALWLELDMPQERLREIRMGDPIELEKPYLRAHVIQVSQNIRPDSQSALVRALIDKKDEAIRAGQNINVQLMHASTDFIARLPVSAVVMQGGGSYVFVKDKDGFMPREVAIAGTEPHYVVIHEGLVAGDEVVVQGVTALKAAWLGIGE